MTDFCQLQLTCADKEEANKIASTLLVKHLVACVKQMPVNSTYWWQGKMEVSDEIMLIMDSKPQLFAKIEAEIAKIHSYDTFVLQQLPINKVSEKVKAWLEKYIDA